ncbi:MAG: CAP domain-containing protein [Ruminococcus sp.]|nr:CAP domain-containing protein [Ruminococcus sp.]
MKNTRKHISVLTILSVLAVLTSCGQVNEQTESKKYIDSSVDSSSVNVSDSLSESFSNSDSSIASTTTTTTTTASSEEETSNVTTTSIVVMTNSKGNVVTQFAVDESGRTIALDKDGKPKTTTKKSTSGSTGSTSSGNTTTRKNTSNGSSSSSSGSGSSGGNSSYNNSGNSSNGNAGNSSNRNSGSNNSNSGNSGNSGNSQPKQTTTTTTTQETQAPEPTTYDVCGLLLSNWTPEDYGMACATIVGGSYDENKCYNVACELYEKNKSTYERGLSLINRIRAEAGCNPLELDRDLCIAATMRSLEQDLVTGISHTRPNGTGIEELIKSRFSNIWSEDNFYGENCCEGAFDIDSAVDAWRNSPGHYGNMIHSIYTKVGFGFSKYTGIEYWTADFEGEIDWDF